MKQDPMRPLPRKRQKERSHRVVDPQAELEKLKQKLKAIKPQKKRKLMQGSIPMRDTMEGLSKQHKLHNQGARMEEEEKAQEAPQESQACAILVGTSPPKAEHGST